MRWRVHFVLIGLAILWLISHLFARALALFRNVFSPGLRDIVSSPTFQPDLVQWATAAAAGTFTYAFLTRRQPFDPARCLIISLCVAATVFLVAYHILFVVAVVALGIALWRVWPEFRKSWQSFFSSSRNERAPDMDDFELTAEIENIEAEITRVRLSGYPENVIEEEVAALTRRKEELQRRLSG